MVLLAHVDKRHTEREKDKSDLWFCAQFLFWPYWLALRLILYPLVYKYVVWRELRQLRRVRRRQARIEALEEELNREIKEFEGELKNL